MRARLERWLARGWLKRGVVHWAFFDLSIVFGWIARRRRRKFLAARQALIPIGLPVVVVGSIVAGGSGKTPVVIALVEALRARGYKPGVVSRGYRGKIGPQPISVTVDTDPLYCGDEPLLIARRTGVPVFVHPKRVWAARALRAAYPAVDVIVSDDGLQHYGLARQVELVVFDARGVGNGRSLPAGPLREPIDRPRDATLFIDTSVIDRFAAGSPTFAIDLIAGPAYRLASHADTRENASWTSQRVSAYGGIGHPDKFFETLRGMGAQVDAHPLGDHHRYRADAFRKASNASIVITEKDAVKCVRIPELKNDPRVWVLPIRAELPKALIDQVVEKIVGSQAA